MTIFLLDHSTSGDDDDDDDDDDESGSQVTTNDEGQSSSHQGPSLVSIVPIDLGPNESSSSSVANVRYVKSLEPF